jgi:nucleoside-diphosphate-sugar epimerase
MSGRILVLGAAGRFGHAAADAFRRAGWTVKSLVRPGAAQRAPRDTLVIEGNALDHEALTEAARDVDVVLHALNPPYTDWPRLALPLAYAAIAAAETTGATLLFPGNVYNYGAGMPPVLDENTPMRPTSRKGQLRVTIEERMREAAERGTRTIVLRAGDFYGGGRGSWFDLVVAKDIGRGRVTYPGPLEPMHEWTYLPDVTNAMVALAAVRDRLEAFETFGFPGHAVTGQQFVDAIGRAARRPIRTKRMSWWLIHAVRPFVPICRELSEMEYLWRVPHRIAGDKLRAAIGDIPQTPLDRAVTRALHELDPAA